MNIRNISRRSVLTWLLIIVAATFTPLTAQKLRPEELVAKHLEAIGTVEARASVRLRR
jgi:hypothetical protein